MPEAPSFVGTPTKMPVIGSDCSGVIEEIGSNVRGWKVGDEVFLDGGPGGTMQDLCDVPAKKLALKPAELSHVDAAALPVAGLTALIGLRDGRVTQGSRVLITGASGGVGALAVRIAIALGATHVTAVGRVSKIDQLRQTGAHAIITTGDDGDQSALLRTSERYDVVLDCAAVNGIRAMCNLLTPNGRYCHVGGFGWPWGMGSIFRTLFLMPVYWLFTKKRLCLVLLKESAPADLDFLAGLVVENRLQTMVGDVISLDEVPDTLDKMYHRTIATGGKIVVDLTR